WKRAIFMIVFASWMLASCGDGPIPNAFLDASSGTGGSGGGGGIGGSGGSSGIGGSGGGGGTGSSSTIAWNGGNFFLYGVNYPWLTYGTDFGSGPWGHLANPSQVQADMATFANEG